jgi:citrate lyase subunit gamma (acyl carrier protein)
MKIIKSAVAGTLESSDAYIEIAPHADGITIEIESIVLNRFESEIRKAVQAVLDANGIANAAVSVKDRGALDCTIRARMETAIKRAVQEAAK